MTSNTEIHELLRDAIPKATDAMAKLATTPDTSATNRLKAMKLLLRVVAGPVGRRSDERDRKAAHAARAALAKALPLLNEIALTHRSKAIRGQATKMKILVKNALGS